MASVVPDGGSAKLSGPLKETQREGPSALELVAALSAIPGVERLAGCAHEQMLQACRDMNREYPRTSGSRSRGSSESTDPAMDLQILIENGANDEQATRRLGVLALLGTTLHWPIQEEGMASLARDLFWLETESRLPVLSLAVAVLDETRKSQLVVALRHLATNTNEASRGQKCLAILWSQALSGDPGALRAVLDGGESAGESQICATTLEARTPAIHGRLLTAPRGPLLTAVAAFTGWMLIRHLSSYLSRYVLAYRAQADLSVSERGIEIHEQTTILGRKLRDRTRLISLQTVRSLSREVRYARLGTYAGLASLAIGSFVGMRLFVDGVRAPGFSGPTMLMGLLIVLAGLGLDFAFANWLNVSRAQCRLLIETAQGRGLYLNCDEPSKVDGMLLELASKLPA